MDDTEAHRLRELIQGGRWVALATADESAHPCCSWVACAHDADFLGFVMHLSSLALHTRNLLSNPFASLAISVPDNGQDDPQLLPRVTITGPVRTLSPSDASYEKARRIYLDRFPEAEPRFSFADFRLFRLQVESAQFVSGFARARKLLPAALRAVAPGPRD